MRMWRGLLVAVVIGHVSTACQTQAPQNYSFPEEDAAAIRGAAEGFVKAVLANDWATAASRYTEDAVFMPADHPAFEGHEAWERWVASFDIKSVTHYSMVIDEIDGHADIAFVRGRFSETLMINGLESPVKAAGKFVQVWRKQPNGAWLLAIDMYNLNGAAEPET